MPFIQDDDKPEIRKILSDMEDPVELVLFTREVNCQYCRETRELLQELSELADGIHLSVYDLQSDNETAQTYNVDKAPAIVIKGNEDYGIRYYGIPSGYEFSSLLEDVLDVSRGDPGFNEHQLEQIARIREPLHLQVFVTPTCPYCPTAVRNAHRMAMVNSNITADMIEATEFQELSQQYGVRGVPRTMVNEDHHIDGGLPEEAFINQIVEQVDTNETAKA